MTTRDVIIGAFMGVGALAVGLDAFGVHTLKDVFLFSGGVCLFMVGRILDRFWTAA